MSNLSRKTTAATASSTALNARVDAKELLSARLMILRVVADGWQLPHFKPGQYTVLGLPPEAPRCALSVAETTPSLPGRLIRRAYSIASSSLNREFLDFYIRLVSSGALTPRLFALEVGDALWLSSKMTGLFTLDQVPGDRNLVMIATGTGLAPYMSMLSTHLQCNSQRRIAVLHGAQHSWDLGYRSELMAFEHLCPNFTYLPTVSRPESEPVEWNGPVGRVQPLWTSGAVGRAWGFAPTPTDTDVFLCGSPAMIDDMIELLSTQGFREQTSRQPGQVHVERF